MASVKDIKAQISSLKTQIPSSPKIEHPVKTESTQPDKGLGAFLTTLVEGKDYGKLPGVQTPVLFKRGAQKILSYLNYHYKLILVDKTIVAKDKLLAYTVAITILTADKKYVTQALGSANSLESKFAKSGFSSDNMLVTMAAKRALVSAVKEIINSYPQ